MSCRTRRIK